MFDNSEERRRFDEKVEALEKAYCKHCGEPIYWVKTIGGGDMPLSIKPMTIVTPDGKVVKGFTPHFIVCPHKNEERAEGKRVTTSDLEGTRLGE